MPDVKYYAGVGSRRVPIVLLPRLRELAEELERRGWVLRSGGAKGCDAAFESGVRADAHKQIFYPTRGHIPALAFDIAKTYHPAWARLSGYAKRCHARNSQQVLGPALDEPSEFVLCWTPEAREVGGTSQAIRVARAMGVDVFNIADEKRLHEFLEIHLQGYSPRAIT